MAASHLCWFRQDRRLTLGAFSVLSGLSVAYISRIERRERPPTPEAVVALARGLGTSAQRLASLLAEPEPDAEPEHVGATS